MLYPFNLGSFQILQHIVSISINISFLFQKVTFLIRYYPSTNMTHSIPHLLIYVKCLSYFNCAMNFEQILNLSQKSLCEALLQKQRKSQVQRQKYSTYQCKQTNSHKAYKYRFYGCFVFLQVSKMGI